MPIQRQKRCHANDGKNSDGINLLPSPPSDEQLNHCHKHNVCKWELIKSLAYGLLLPLVISWDILQEVKPEDADCGSPSTRPPMTCILWADYLYHARNWEILQLI